MSILVFDILHHFSLHHLFLYRNFQYNKNLKNILQPKYRFWQITDLLYENLVVLLPKKVFPEKKKHFELNTILAALRI